MRIETLGPVHPGVANAISDMGSFYADLNKYDDAEKMYRKALAMYETTLGPAHPKSAGTLLRLAEMYYASGRNGDAADAYKSALPILERVHGPENPNLAPLLNSYAAVLKKLKRKPEATVAQQRAKRMLANRVNLQAGTVDVTTLRTSKKQSYR
jgi:tetratricopeptide (TPR) repeat protein